MAGVNLPEAYSKILDKKWTLESVVAPAFKGKYEGVNGLAKQFKVFSPIAQKMRDYSTRKSANTPATFGYEYKDSENNVQTITVSQDKYFAHNIDLSDAKFSKDGSLDAKEVMQTQLEEETIPEMDIYAISKLATGAGKTIVKAITDTNAFSTFKEVMTAQTNARVPRKGRVAFVGATTFAALTLDPKFSVPSDMVARMNVTGFNHGKIDGCMVIEVPDDYLPTKYTIVATHEKAAAFPKALADYNQGKFKETSSGYYVNGRAVYEAFVFDQKKAGVIAVKSA